MPRTRSDQHRDDKREAILTAAASLFATQGVARTSVAAIAAEAGITKNTVYWYFADKDALLIAVIASAVRAARVRWQEKANGSLADTLVLIAGTFDGIRSLTTALHARLETSSSVREWHERFHQGSDAWLAGQIRAHLAQRGTTAAPDALVDTSVRLWTYAIEGMVADELSVGERQALCRQLVAQLELSARALPGRRSVAQPAGRGGTGGGVKSPP